MLTLTAMLGLVGFLVAGSIARSATQANGTVSLSKTKLGEVLVNSKGHTLYMFCQGQERQELLQRKLREVLAALPSARQGTAGTGVKASLLGTTRRSNGSMQVTYKKHPLYGFALDKKAGQTNGEGNVAFGGE